MSDFDWKKTIGAVAPMIATALGSPLAGMAVSAIATALGVDSDEASVKAAMANATPDQFVELRKADNEFKRQMAEIGYKSIADLEKIAAEDRANARAREMATNDWMPKVLGLLIVIGFFTVLGYLVENGIPMSGGEALLILLGALGAAFGAIVNYYYGSSSGSAEKTRQISNMQK